MAHISYHHSPAFKQAQANALQIQVETVHNQLVYRFGLPDDHDTHLLVQDMLKSLVQKGLTG